MNKKIQELLTRTCNETVQDPNAVLIELMELMVEEENTLKPLVWKIEQLADGTILEKDQKGNIVKVNPPTYGLDFTKRNGDINKEDTGIWKPKADEEYFYINNRNFVDDEVFIEHSKIHEDLVAMGGAFQTKELAEQHLERLKVTQQLKELAGGYTGSQCRISLTQNNELEIASTLGLKEMGVIYFKTKVQAQHAIDTIGDKLKVLF